MTAFLIFTIFLRTSSARMFNQHRKAVVQQKELLRKLWQKQLQFESLVNPAGIPGLQRPALREEIE